VPEEFVGTNAMLEPIVQSSFIGGGRAGRYCGESECGRIRWRSVITACRYSAESPSPAREHVLRSPDRQSAPSPDHSREVCCRSRGRREREPSPELLDRARRGMAQTCFGLNGRLAPSLCPAFQTMRCSWPGS